MRNRVSLVIKVDISATNLSRDSLALTPLPIEVPIIQTDLEIKPVKIETGADIGMNAIQ